MRGVNSPPPYPCIRNNQHTWRDYNTVYGIILYFQWLIPPHPQTLPPSKSFLFPNLFLFNLPNIIYFKQFMKKNLISPNLLVIKQYPIGGLHVVLYKINSAFVKITM